MWRTQMFYIPTVLTLKDICLVLVRSLMILMINLVEKDPIQSFDINDLDLTNNLYYKLDRGQLSKSLFFGKGASLIVAR